MKTKVKRVQVGRSRNTKVVQKPKKGMKDRIENREIALQKERWRDRELMGELEDFGIPFSSRRVVRLGPSRLQPDFYEIAGFSDEAESGFRDEFDMGLFGLDGY